jgi:hypothetical protein
VKSTPKKHRNSWEREDSNVGCRSSPIGVRVHDQGGSAGANRVIPGEDVGRSLA